MNDPMRIRFDVCPLCDSTSFTHEATGDCSRHALYKRELPPRIRWYRCESCGHVFAEGYFTPEANALIFGQTKVDQRVGHDIERQRNIAALMVEAVLPFVSKGRWLDVGFGNGALLFAAQEYGFEPVGTDMRTDNAAALAKLGIEAHTSDLESLELSQPCHVISMADVLEHMPFPKRGLAAVHKFLEDDGVILVSMPNSETMLWRVFNESSTNPYWGELEHYHNFGRTRLYSLLAEMGFEPLKYGVSQRYRACMEVIARKARVPVR
jgi:protein O-GlcNAc transferase